MLQTLFTRIFSVTMWYHFAFMAVSIALFGMTLGALIVYLQPRHFPEEHAKTQLSLHALLFAVAIIAGFIIHLYVPYLTGTGSVGGGEGVPQPTGAPKADGWISTAAYLSLTYVSISIPFVFAGICVCIALTRFRGQVARLYAADLAGAAVGCVCFILALRVTDGPTAVFMVAAFAALGALAFAFDQPRKWLITAALTVFVSLGIFTMGHAILAHRQAPLVRLVYSKGTETARPIYEHWNEFAYFRMYRHSEVPTGWGFSTTFEPRWHRVPQIGVFIDAWAGTYLTRWDGDPDRLDHLRYDVTNFVHYVRRDADVLVVGVGGGRDVLSALAFEQRSVTGVEINGDLLDVVSGRFGDFTGHLDRDPRVRLVADEARSYITRQEDRYGIVQVSMIDTFAATAAGAFVLTENTLYTVEAWRVFLDRLTESGVMSFSRWYTPSDPAEVQRLFTLATAALRDAGIERPDRHMVMVTNIPEGADMLAGIGTLLVCRTPFTEEDLAAVADAVERLEFGVLYAPGLPGDPVLSQIARSTDLDEFASSFPLDISPPTDDRPFFFNMLRIQDVFSPGRIEGHVNAFNLKAVTTLGSLLVIVLGLTLLCIIVPLVLTRRRSRPMGAARYILFFGAIGFGFMLVEISQLQRLIVFLGHPTYGLSVVLFSLLLSSGIGSYLTPVCRDTSHASRSAWRLIAIVAVLVVLGLVTPPITSALRGATNGVRIAVAAALLAPPGLFMGMAFPLGMSVANLRSRRLTPWLWGINGAASVSASVLAVVLALAWGISAAFWGGVGCYIVAFVSYLGCVRSAPTSQTAP